MPFDDLRREQEEREKQEQRERVAQEKENELAAQQQEEVRRITPRYIAESGIYQLIEELSSITGIKFEVRTQWSWEVHRIWKMRDINMRDLYAQLVSFRWRETNGRISVAEIGFYPDGTVRTIQGSPGDNHTLRYPEWRNNPKLLEGKLVAAFKLPASYG